VVLPLHGMKGKGPIELQACEKRIERLQDRRVFRFSQKLNSKVSSIESLKIPVARGARAPFWQKCTSHYMEVRNG
jgi:hypothetical protein